MATVDVATGLRGTMVETTLAEAAVTVAVRGDLDDAAIPEVAQAIADAVSGAGTHDVVLDLGDVAFIDATGLEFIVRCRRSLTRVGGTLSVSRPTEQVERLLAVCGIVDLKLSSRGAPPGRAPAWQSLHAVEALAPDVESREYAT